MYRCEQRIFPFVMTDLRHYSLSEAKKPQYVGGGCASVFRWKRVYEVCSLLSLFCLKMGRSSHWSIISVAWNVGHSPNFSHDCGHIPSSESCEVYIVSPLYYPNISVEPSTTVCAQISPPFDTCQLYFPGVKGCYSMMLNISPFVASVMCGDVPPLPKLSWWHGEGWPKCYKRNLFHSTCFMKFFCRGLGCFWERINVSKPFSHGGACEIIFSYPKEPLRMKAFTGH